MSCAVAAFWCLAHWPAHAIALEAITQAEIAADAWQTASMGTVDHYGGYQEREIDCLIGHYPSTRSVALAFGGMALGHFLLTNALEKVSPKWATTFQVLSIGWEGATIGWNAHIGLRF